MYVYNYYLWSLQSEGVKVNFDILINPSEENKGLN